MPNFEDSKGDLEAVTARFRDEDVNPYVNENLQAASYGSVQNRGGVVIPTLRPNETGNPYDRTYYNGNSNVVDRYMEASQSVVAIEDSVMAKGTGFFVTSDGLLATDLHVVHDAQGPIRIKTADGRSYTATIENVDPGNDIAILRLNTRSPYERFRALPLGNSNLGYQQEVLSVGRPHDWGNLFLSQGLVAAYKPYSQVAKQGTLPSWNNPNRGMFQMYMHTDSGNSGSPVLDTSGRVVGMVDLSDNNKWTSATPVEAIQRLLSQTWQPRDRYAQTYDYCDRYSRTQPYYNPNSPRWDDSPGWYAQPYYRAQPSYSYGYYRPQPRW